MQVFKIEHDHFDLEVKCLSFNIAFSKAKKHQKYIENATKYIFSSGFASIINPVTETMERISSQATLPVFLRMSTIFLTLTSRKLILVQIPRF